MVTKLHCRCVARHGSGGRDGSAVLTTSGSAGLSAGPLLVWGGEVLALRPGGEWIEVAVLERPLGFRDRPRLDRTPRGRFAGGIRLDEGGDQLGPARVLT